MKKIPNLTMSMKKKRKLCQNVEAFTDYAAADLLVKFSLCNDERKNYLANRLDAFIATHIGDLVFLYNIINKKKDALKPRCYNRAVKKLHFRLANEPDIQKRRVRQYYPHPQ